MRKLSAYYPMEKNYKAPPVAWLKITDFMHGWVQKELGGGARIRNMRVVSVQHIPGARNVLKMETVEDMMERKPVVNAMSATRMNCISAGMELDASVIEKMYGITEDSLKLFMPIECPKMCLTKSGVLRPWTLDVCFGKDQATALQRLVRTAFWNAVEEFDAAYSRKCHGRRYPAKEMIEDFCVESETPDLYVDAIRREWQRRMKRNSQKGDPVT